MQNSSAFLIQDSVSNNHQVTYFPFTTIKYPPLNLFDRFLCFKFMDIRGPTFAEETHLLRGFSVTFYIFFCVASFACLRNSKSKMAFTIMYMVQFILELWNIILVDFNNIFKLSSFFLLFNIGFIYAYIVFAHEINVGIFNLIAFMSLVLFSVVYYFMEDIDGKIHMILNPYSCIVGCYFFVVWITLFLFNKNKFDELMYLKFPFEIYFEFGKILSKNVF